jgi:hypothetical protein
MAVLTAHLPLPNAMPAFALRFVGQEALPPRLNEFDREQFFTLTSADVAAVREQFPQRPPPARRADVSINCAVTRMRSAERRMLPSST